MANKENIIIKLVIQYLEDFKDISSILPQQVGKKWIISVEEVHALDVVIDMFTDIL